MEQTNTDPRTLTIGGAKDSRTSLRIVQHKFIIGKEEFHPFVAEMHYYRIPKRHWSVCFERIRRAEFRIISTSVPWNLHETRQGDFDFAGTSDQTKDLIVFLELCREFGFRIMLRPGPWIATGWNRGGLPDFATRHAETIAKDPEGQPLTANPGPGGKDAVVPSYLSNRFQILLKNYFSVFAEVVRNYIYPRGPVFMIEIDNETSFGGHFNPFSADYNPQGTRAAFPHFLEEKYESIDQLKKIYKVKASEFGDIEPPVGWDGKSSQDFCKALDWIEFREWVVNRYAESVADLLSQTEISALFSRSLAQSGPYSFPNVQTSRTGGRVLFTTNLGWDVPASVNEQRARSVSGWQATGFCSSLAIGAAHEKPEIGRTARPITAGDTKRLIVTALAGGIRGFNFHMLVGHDHWYDAALESDGAIQPSFDIIRDAIARLQEARYETMRDFAPIAMVRYRPYSQTATLPDMGPYEYIRDLVGASFDDLCEDIRALGYDYRIFDLTHPHRLDEYPMIIAPVAEFMDEEAQTRLLDLVQNGAHLLLYGLMPKTDNRLNNCDVLAKGLSIRTTAKVALLEVEAQKRTYTVPSLGVVSRSSTTASRIVKSKTKTLGVSAKCGKGHVTMLTFYPGSRLSPERLGFISELLASAKLKSPVTSSDPRIHVSAMAHAKGALIMIYDVTDPASIPSSGSEIGDGVRPVILSIDLKALGLTGRSFALTDLLGTDATKMPAKELATGIEIRLRPGDSRLYYLEKKS